MRHVAHIKKIVEEGQRDEALVAIENLLYLGPKNLEALKLKALIFASEGKFEDETQVWLRILQIDNEDVDAIEFFLRKQHEDREHFYFTDPIANGGRRYLAYPRKMFTAALLGLFGCGVFVTISRMSTVYPVLGRPTTLLSAFGILVLLPWIAIMWSWARSLKSLSVISQGITAQTRFKSLAYKWTDLNEVVLANDGNPYDPTLWLVIRPNDIAATPLLIDLSEASSSLRARSHLIRDVMQLAPQFRFAPLASLGLNLKKTKSF